MKLLATALLLSLAVSMFACMNAASFPSRSPERTVIVLDPGHDSVHAGANYHGAAEEDLVYRIAEYCRAALEQQGYQVFLTRGPEGCAAGTSSGIDGLRDCLEHRVTIALKQGAVLMVSLHLNASGNHTASGAEVYIPNRNYNRTVSDQAGLAAAAIRKELKALGLKDLGTKTRDVEDDTVNPDGSKADYYKIIREGKWAHLPVLIVEHAFLDNDQDYDSFLNTEEKLRALGEADARGIIQALNQNQ